MKFTLAWLKDYLDTSASLEEISEKLTAIGLEVEEIIDRSKIYKDFIVGHVKKCEQHPDADCLNLCVVNDGKTDHDVVCGAPNVAAGQNICFAPVGSIVPANGMEIKAAKIRGQTSNGMICSEAELNLSDEAAGIMVLSEDAPAGESFANYMGLNDPVIEIALTPDRADCAGVYGIARDLAAAGLGTLKPIEEIYKNLQIKESFASDQTVKLDFSKDHAEACSHFAGRVIQGVQNGPSPRWLKQRLTAIGSRSISALVDITNYICIAFNRPLHFFDADKLKGEVVIRLAKAKETIEALDEKTYTLGDQMVVISDDNGAQAIGGIMGGAQSECDDKTVNILIESAYFDPDYTRNAGQVLKIESDAKYRFERGVDPQFTKTGLDIAIRMVLDICGGEASQVIEAGQALNPAQIVEYPYALLKSLTGVDLDHKKQSTILEALGFEIKTSDKAKATLVVPSWRHDIEGQADIVEEVLRIYGYDQIPLEVTTRETVTRKAAYIGKEALIEKARHTLAMTRGLNESVTWSFLAPKMSALFTYDDVQPVRIANPISEDLSVMRQSIVPNLLKAAQNNHDRGHPNVSLFEIGPVFWGQTPDTQPIVITGLRSGAYQTKTWADQERANDAFDAKADVIAALDTFGMSVENMPISTDTPPWYHPGRSGQFMIGKKPLAIFGELHPGLLQQLGIEFPVVSFEIITQNIPFKEKKKTAKPYVEFSSLQPVKRDFAFVLEESVAVNDVKKTVASVDRQSITDVHVFDVYQGKGVDDGHKSVALTVTIQPKDKTLTDQDIEALSQKVIDQVEKKVGGSLRS